MNVVVRYAHFKTNVTNVLYFCDLSSETSEYIPIPRSESETGYFLT